MSEIKKLVLSGYFGYDNSGDEAILYTIVEGLRNRGIEPIILSGNPEKTAQVYRCKTYNRMNFDEVREAIKESDGLISGGGSLLQDATSVKSVIYYLSVIQLAHLSKKPVFFYSQGVGPINKKFLYYPMRFVLNKCTYLSVRDKESKAFLENEVKLKKEVHLTADPVLSLTYNEKDIVLEDYLKEFLKEKPITLSLRDWKGNEKLLEECILLVKCLLDKGEKVLLLPMHYPSDVQFLKKVYEPFKKERNVYFHSKEMHFLGHLECMKESKMVIGMRLHSLIYAANRHTPFVGISYDPKIDSFLGQFSMKNASTVENFSVVDILERVSEIQSNYEKEKREIKEKQKTLQRLSESPLDAIVQYFH